MKQYVSSGQESYDFSLPLISEYCMGSLLGCWPSLGTTLISSLLLPLSVTVSTPWHVVLCELHVVISQKHVILACRNTYNPPQAIVTTLLPIRISVLQASCNVLQYKEPSGQKLSLGLLTTITLQVVHFHVYAPFPELPFVSASWKSCSVVFSTARDSASIT
jgi:hypothetical protein